MMGSMNAAVLPLPVSAWPFTSRPEAVTMDDVCMNQALTVHENGNCVRLNLARLEVLRLHDVVEELRLEVRVLPVPTSRQVEKSKKGFWVSKALTQ